MRAVLGVVGADGPAAERVQRRRVASPGDGEAAGALVGLHAGLCRRSEDPVHPAGYRDAGIDESLLQRPHRVPVAPRAARPPRSPGAPRLSALSVAVSTRPVATRPRERWYALTADSVPGPKTPSTPPGTWMPALTRLRCSWRTRSPTAPRANGPLDDARRRGTGQSERLRGRPVDDARHRESLVGLERLHRCPSCRTEVPVHSVLHADADADQRPLEHPHRLPVGPVLQSDHVIDRRGRYACRLRAARPTTAPSAPTSTVASVIDVTKRRTRRARVRSEQLTSWSGLLEWTQGLRPTTSIRRATREVIPRPPTLRRLTHLT